MDGDQRVGDSRGRVVGDNGRDRAVGDSVGGNGGRVVGNSVGGNWGGDRVDDVSRRVGDSN